MEVQLEYTHNAHMFMHVRCWFVCLLTKFLRQSTVRSLLRVRCWLGTLEKHSKVEVNWYCPVVHSCNVVQGNDFLVKEEEETKTYQEIIILLLTWFLSFLSTEQRLSGGKEEEGSEGAIGLARRYRVCRQISICLSSKESLSCRKKGTTMKEWWNLKKERNCGPPCFPIWEGQQKCRRR